MSHEGTKDQDKKNGMWKRVRETLERAAHEISKLVEREVQDFSYMEIITAVGDTTVEINKDAENIVEGLTKPKSKDDKKTLDELGKKIGEKPIPDVRILARTRIELDGDIALVLPDPRPDQIETRAEILRLHKENVNVAVQNWNTFFRNMLLGAGLVFGLFGNNPNVIDMISKLPFKDWAGQSQSASTPSLPEVTDTSTKATKDQEEKDSTEAP